jgi:hypothetical protein
MHLSKFFHSETGRVMFSIILGFGLATLFRSVCKGKNCIAYKAPSLEDVEGKTFRYDNKCYKYTAVSGKCDKNKQIYS